MKKIICVFVCMLLAAALAVTALAAGNAQFSISPASKTLYRGDTVTFSVSLSSSEPATQYGLMLSYDTSVFELAGGTCAASGALVNSFNNGFAFMFQTPTAYSGSVGTVTLKVKDNAAFGTFSVSGSASAKNGSATVAASGCSATVTVACKHSYGPWSESGSGHQQACSICNDVKTENHTWDKGTTLKQATCKEGGQVKYTCTACSVTKTEDTAKTTTHSYSKWTKVDDSTHTHTCSVCAKEETAKHSWNSGTATKKATCKAEGEMLYTCTGCSATKTEVVAKLTTHTYDHGCDTDCNVCGVTRTTTHSYKKSWSKDKNEHWHECSECNDKKDSAAHTPGAEPTETTAQTCTVCGYIIKAALGHTHDYADSWTTDEAGHWYACSGCDEKGSYADHDFENACDTDCSICGYTRETAHAYGDWESDEVNHWQSCSGCGEKAEEAAHVPGVEATAATAQTCTVCAYEIAPALGGEETEPTEDTEATELVSQEQPEENSFPWWILIVAVLVIGGAVVFFVVKKKKA